MGIWRMGASDLAGFLNIFMPLLMVAVAVVLYFWRGWTERTALQSAMKNLSGNEYSVLEHPGIRTPEGIVTVDYAVVSVYGIFLVVTSDFKGRVTGSEDASEWTLSNRRGAQAVENPLMRVDAFARALHRALPNYRFARPVAIVAYPARDILNVRSTQHVTYLSKVMDIIGSYNVQTISFSQASGMAAALRYADVNNGADDAVLSDMM